MAKKSSSLVLCTWPCQLVLSAIGYTGRLTKMASMVEIANHLESIRSGHFFNFIFKTCDIKTGAYGQQVLLYAVIADGGNGE